MRQIAMDGVIFTRQLPVPADPQQLDCSHEEDNSEFDELSDFNLAPGNRIDVLRESAKHAG